MIRSFVAFALILTVCNVQASDLTRVVKDKCLLLPQLKQVSDMLAGVEYTLKMDYTVGCLEDQHGNIYECSTQVQLGLRYRYQIVSTVEHYTRDGRLASTSKEREAVVIGRGAQEFVQGEYDSDRDFNYTPVDAVANAQFTRMSVDARRLMEREIQKVLFESADGACEGSHYQ